MRTAKRERERGRYDADAPERKPTGRLRAARPSCVPPLSVGDMGVVTVEKTEGIGREKRDSN